MTGVGGLRHIRSYHDFVYLIGRHKKKVLFAALGVLLSACGVTFLARPVYRSEAKLLVRPGRENLVVDPLAEQGNVLGLSRSWENEINSELAILTSRAVAEKIVDRLGPKALLSPAEGTGESSPEAARGGLARNLSLRSALRNLCTALGLREEVGERQQALLILAENLHAETLRKSNVISLAYEASSPELARRVLDAVVTVYQEQRKSIYRPRESYEFFLRQTEQLHKELAETQKRLRDLKNRYGVASIEDWRRILTERIGTLEEDIQKTTAQLAAAQAKVKSLKASLEELPEKVETLRTESSPSYGSDLMRQRLFDLKVKELDLIARYGAGTTPVQVVRQQVQEAEKLLKKESIPRRDVTVGLNTTRQQIEQLLFAEQAQVAALQVHLEALQAYLAGMRADVESLNETEMQLANVKRELKIQEANYRRYAENREQARIDRAIAAEKLSSVSVMQPATLPIRPVRPRRVLSLILGICASLFAGLATAFLGEYMSNAIGRPEEAESELHLPTLACIPRLPARRLRPQSSFAEKVGEAAAASGARARRAWDAGERVRESYEALQARLALSLNGAGAPKGIIGVTSCYPGEGASTVAANLASHLSQAEYGRVLLAHVEGKGQKRRYDRFFRIPAVLHTKQTQASSQPALRPVQVGGTLDLLPSLSRQYGLKALQLIVEQLRKRYPFVVLDLPPATLDSAAVKWAPVTDGVILVMEQDRVPFEVAKRTKALLEEAQCRLLGLVWNKGGRRVLS